MTGDNGIHQEIGQAADLTRTELVASWRKLIMSPRSKGVRRVLHECASAIRIYMRANGAVTSTARVKFLAIAGRSEVAKPAAPERHENSSAASQVDSQRHCRTAECCP
jgi:hypothetical protein